MSYFEIDHTLGLTNANDSNISYELVASGSSLCEMLTKSYIVEKNTATGQYGQCIDLFKCNGQLFKTAIDIVYNFWFNLENRVA